MKLFFTIFLSLFSLFVTAQTSSLINTDGKTVETRFKVPNGFIRSANEQNSYGYFLSSLPLKPHNSLVLYYIGSQKTKNNVYDAVVNLPIGDKDLHQCADAVMRLRADYLYQQKKYNQIHFNFTNGFKVDYDKWRKGYRIGLKGNSTFWKLSAKPSDSYEDYWKYLEQIFMYAGTSSLSKELKPIPFSDLKIGDVLIKGGFPGHAVIVVDVATNSKTNKKVYLLAQSYMPAQDLQILKNPNNEAISPWYEVNNENEINTPEWTFKSNELKRF